MSRITVLPPLVVYWRGGSGLTATSAASMGTESHSGFNQTCFNHRGSRAAEITTRCVSGEAESYTLEAGLLYRGRGRVGEAVIKWEGLVTSGFVVSVSTGQQSE